ncbi:hypothetical protein B7494_g625 [Chlorociboria aeruginascens]|nr:hypothetical protein B7494_g625 [Chlorociboria aeruginascens]
MFLVGLRFGIDTFIFVILVNLWLHLVQKETVSDVEKAEDLTEINIKALLSPGESVERHGERTAALRTVATAVWNQEFYFRDGRECRRWFLERIRDLPVKSPLQRLHKKKGHQPSPWGDVDAFIMWNESRDDSDSD